MDNDKTKDHQTLSENAALSENFYKNENETNTSVNYVHIEDINKTQTTENAFRSADQNCTKWEEDKHRVKPIDKIEEVDDLRVTYDIENDVLLYNITDHPPMYVTIISGIQVRKSTSSINMYAMYFGSLCLLVNLIQLLDSIYHGICLDWVVLRFYVT